MFVWDLVKAKANIKKHGVKFENACGVFFDLDALEVPARSVEEKRFIRLGKGFDNKILIVVYTIRLGLDGEEKIRIISARQASKKERQAYARF